jgi:hypothetical protein
MQIVIVIIQNVVSTNALIFLIINVVKVGRVEFRTEYRPIFGSLC